MGLKIVDLLKFKDVVILKDGKGMPILDDKKNPVEVYIKVIGDDDLDKAHRAARLASASIRKILQDKTSDQYKDRVEPIMEAPRQDCIDLIIQYRTANLESEARAAVEREELPTIEEFAVIPDAPTLEEMEELDAAIDAQNTRYAKAIEDYMNSRADVIRAELEEMELKDLQQLAADNVAGIVALAEFFTVLMAEKLTRGSFTDKAYKIKAFDSVDEFLATDSIIKEQLINAYTDIEYGADDVKN